MSPPSTLSTTARLSIVEHRLDSVEADVDVINRTLTASDKQDAVGAVTDENRDERISRLEKSHNAFKDSILGLFKWFLITTGGIVLAAIVTFALKGGFVPPGFG